MAKIGGLDGVKTFQVQKWLGLNESPDGDTGLKMGEAAEMRNFRITREKNLQLRPGYSSVCTVFAGKPIQGLWCGYVAGKQHLLAACEGKLWAVEPTAPDAADQKKGWKTTKIGSIGDGAVFFFGFSKKVYLLTGAEYYCWDGTLDETENVNVVEGYIPMVATATVPSGGGTLLEPLNNLTGKRRQRFSPDGTDKAFHLIEENIDEIISVEGTQISYVTDKTKGTVTFATVPPKGTDTVVITWRKGNGSRDKVAKMRFAELYNGASDSRVFLYGNGTNETIYSDLGEASSPTAEYFPDLNVMAVDSANTPITAMIRHYDRMLIFKSDSTHSAQYGTITTAEGAVKPAFYASPLNREIGCGAPGQVKLVENDPISLFGRGAYQWTLTVGAGRDERNAKRLSDRVEATLGRFNLGETVAFDDEERQEYYIVCGGEALVFNYANNSWYYYDHLPARCMVKVDGELYFGTPDGRIMLFSSKIRNDDLMPIDAYWESGAMEFGQDWTRKYSSTLWVSLKPESQAQLTVTAQSNLKSNYAKKLLASGLSTFWGTSFDHWSFGTNRKPQVLRVKLKVKKFTYYTLIFESRSITATATVLGVDMQVRYTGNVK